MKREEKYLVLKWDDIYSALSVRGMNELENIITTIHVHRMNNGKDPSPEFVCIKDSWPVYDTAWSLIEDWVDGK